MKQGLRLYIMGEQVDLSSQPDILYNYVVDDIMNPSVVRNSFSKTITIPGTDRNNRIFNQYWNLERINFDEGFVKQLNHDKAISTVPSWSPDGEKIVFPIAIPPPTFKEVVSVGNTVFSFTSSDMSI